MTKVAMQKFVISPQSSGGAQVTIEDWDAASAVEAFCRTISLLCVIVANRADDAENPHIEFKIGTDRNFYCIPAASLNAPKALLIERAAKRMHAVSCGAGVPWDVLSDGKRGQYLKEAEAALEL